MLWQEGQEVQQGVKSQTSQKDATLPEKTVTFDQFCDSRGLENLEKKKKKFIIHSLPAGRLFRPKVEAYTTY